MKSMSEESKREILEKYLFYTSAPPSLQLQIMDLSSLVHIPLGHCIFSQGLDVEFVALLGSGRVRVYLIGETGREITLYYVNPGESCPTNLMCALFDRAAPAMAVPVETCEALTLPASLFRDWVDQHPPVRWAVMDGLTSRLVNLMALVEEITFQRMDKRLAKYLYDTPGENVDAHTLKLHTTHEAIAYEIGSAREVISRLLTDFERRDWIKCERGCITLTAPDQLKAFAGSEPR